MSMDIKNVYQLTPRQIERLMNKFKETKGYLKYLKHKEEGDMEFINNMIDVPII